MKKMSVLGICGSLRRQSRNMALLRYAKENAPQNMEITIADLSNVPFYNEDIPKKPESVETLLSNMKDADALLLACPEYNFSIAPALKNILDWASQQTGNLLLSGKPTLIMGAGGGMRTGRAQYHLRQVCECLNLHVLNKPELFCSTSDGTFDSVGNLVDVNTKALVLKQLNAFQEWAYKISGLSLAGTTPNNNYSYAKTARTELESLIDILTKKGVVAFELKSSEFNKYIGKIIKDYNPEPSNASAAMRKQRRKDISNNTIMSTPHSGAGGNLTIRYQISDKIKYNVAVMDHPITYSYWVNFETLLAGEHPYRSIPRSNVNTTQKQIYDKQFEKVLNDLFFKHKITCFIDLTDSDEKQIKKGKNAPLHFIPFRALKYDSHLQNIHYKNFPIPFGSVPTVQDTIDILDLIDNNIENKVKTYIHSLYGIGRTGLIIGCWFARHGCTGQKAIERWYELFRCSPQSVTNYPEMTDEQKDHVINWVEMQPELKREFTQYPESTVQQVTSAEGTMQVILDCGKKSMDTVFEYYKKNAQANGWKIEMENTIPEMYMLMLKKGNKWAMVNISTSKNGAIFTILSMFEK